MRDPRPIYWPLHLPAKAWPQAAEQVEPRYANSLLSDAMEDPVSAENRTRVVGILAERSRKEDFPLAIPGYAFRVITALIEKRAFDDLRVFAAAPGTENGKWDVLRTLIYNYKGWHHYPVRMAEGETQASLQQALKPILEVAKKGTTNAYILEDPQGRTLSFNEFFHQEARAELQKNLASATLAPKSGDRGLEWIDADRQPVQ